MPELYDEIAGVYHLVYEDWDAAVTEQAAQLDAVVGERLGPGPHSVLDVSCGIGIQALGLAGLGHRVAASDLSRAAVVRARREARERGLDIAFAVGDMRECRSLHAGPFDVVLSADNSVPHLVGEDAILDALHAFFACLRPGGLAVVTLRDYRPDEDRSSAQLWPYGFRADGDDRWFVVQTRDWEGDRYKVGMYFVREANAERSAEVVAGVSTYRAVTTDRLLELFGEVGFEGAERLDGAFYQPVVVARRPAW